MSAYKLNPAIKRQFGYYSAMVDFKNSRLANFLNFLTPKQRLAYETKGTVPKSKDHVRRYAMYTLAKEECLVEKSRSKFKLIQGGRVWL